MRPNALSHYWQRPRKFFFGCKKEGHFLRDCSQFDVYCRRFQYFCDIGDTSVFILSHNDQELDSPTREVFVYFSAPEAELIDNQDNNDEANESFDTWISELCYIFDKHEFPHVSKSNPHALDNNSYGYITLSIPELK